MGEGEKKCPECGMPKKEWVVDKGAGVKGEDDLEYCCEGCATGADCTCTEEAGFKIESEGSPNTQLPSRLRR